MSDVKVNVRAEEHATNSHELVMKSNHNYLIGTQHYMFRIFPVGFLVNYVLHIRKYSVEGIGGSWQLGKLY